MQIIETIKILADTKDNQILYLEKLGTLPSTDELALQFSDTYQVFKGNLEERVGDFIGQESILNKLDIINLIFNKMSNIPDNTFWNISSLDNIEWKNIRSLARETLPLIVDFEV